MNFFTNRTARPAKPPGPLRIGFGIGLLVIVLALTVVDRFASAPPSLLALTEPHCMNAKLPDYFVSDPGVVRSLGGKSPAYLSGASENFGLDTAAPQTAAAVAADPTGAVASTPVATGGPYGAGRLAITTVERPDAGTLLLAVANDEADRETGLMCVTKMAGRAGMIFVFPNDAVENFWMKDTLIPLDMVFVDAHGKVTSVAADVPSSRLDQSDRSVARRSGRGKYVIELNAGEAARDDIRPGSYLTIRQLPVVN